MSKITLDILKILLTMIRIRLKSIRIALGMIRIWFVLARRTSTPTTGHPCTSSTSAWKAARSVCGIATGAVSPTSTTRTRRTNAPFRSVGSHQALPPPSQYWKVTSIRLCCPCTTLYALAVLTHQTSIIVYAQCTTLLCGCIYCFVFTLQTPPCCSHTGNNSVIERFSLRYSNNGGIKIVGDNNVVREGLLEDLTWLV